MLKKMCFLVTLFAIIFSAFVFGETIELSAPAKKWDGVYIWSARYTTDGQDSCYWKHYDSLCGSWGVTFALIDGKEKNGHKIENVNYLGLDLYLRFKGGPFWSRVGFGLGVFDRRTEDVRSGWDFHLSWQLGYMALKNLGIHIDYGHWSNGASFAEKLGIEGAWPKDENGDTINDGGDTLGIGLTYEFKF